MLTLNNFNYYDIKLLKTRKIRENNLFKIIDIMMFFSFKKDLKFTKESMSKSKLLLNHTN